MSDTFKFVQCAPFTLAGAGATLGDSTVVIQSFQTIDGTNLAMSDFGAIGFGTIDPGNGTREEQISFTGVAQNANGTATLSGVKTVLFVAPYTETANLAKSHAGGATFVITNSAGFYNSLLAKANDETITGLYTFTQLPESTAGDATTDDQLITYGQALALATGTANINRIVVAGNGGEVIAAGNLLYLKVSDGEWYLTDANTASIVDNVILGVAQGAGTDGNPIANGVLLFGLDSNQAGLTNNTAYYASDTLGEISSTPGTVEVSVGVSRSTTSLLFYPRYNQQLTEDQQDALVGTSGTPSSTNKYVTNDDTATTGASKVVRLKANALLDDANVALTTAGDTVYSNGTDLARVAIGGAGAIYMVNAGATAPSWLALGTASQQLRVNSGATAAEWFTPSADLVGRTVVNGGGSVSSGGETTLYTQAIAANTLSTGNVVKASLYIGWDFGANAGNLILRYKYGGTTVATLTLTADASYNGLTGFAGVIETVLMGAGATNSQEGSVYCSMAQNGFVDDGDTASAATAVGLANGTAAEDSTGALNLVVTAQMASGDAGTLTVVHAYTQAIRA